MVKEELESEIIKIIREAYPQVQETTGYQRMVVKEIIKATLESEQVQALVECVEWYSQNCECDCSSKVWQKALEKFRGER